MLNKGGWIEQVANNEVMRLKWQNLGFLFCSSAMAEGDLRRHHHLKKKKV